MDAQKAIMSSSEVAAQEEDPDLAWMKMEALKASQGAAFQQTQITSAFNDEISRFHQASGFGDLEQQASVAVSSNIDLLHPYGLFYFQCVLCAPAYSCLSTYTATLAGAPPGAFWKSGSSASETPVTEGTKSINISPKHTSSELIVSGLPLECKEGVKALWTGIGPNVARNAIINVAELASYDQVKQSILKIHGFTDNVLTHLLSDLGAGFFEVCIRSPVDVLKHKSCISIRGSCSKESNGRIFFS